MAKKKKKKKASVAKKGKKKKTPIAKEGKKKKTPIAKEGKKKKTPIAKEGKKKKAPMTLEDAIVASRKTQSTLEGLLTKVSEGDGFYHREEEEEEFPQLSYEAESSETESGEITEDYVKEHPSFLEAKSVPGPPPGVSLRESIYEKLNEFFTSFINRYEDRYNRWENSISNILSILRKMRKITKKNTEDLVSSIKNLFEKIQAGLDQFKMKRSEVEKVAEIDIQNMSSEFKKVLGLLELQVKEYQLKRMSDELMHEREFFL